MKFPLKTWRKPGKKSKIIRKPGQKSKNLEKTWTEVQNSWTILMNSPFIKFLRVEDLDKMIFFRVENLDKCHFDLDKTWREHGERKLKITKNPVSDHISPIILLSSFHWNTSTLLHSFLVMVHSSELYRKTLSTYVLNACIFRLVENFHDVPYLVVCHNGQALASVDVFFSV